MIKPKVLSVFIGMRTIVNETKITIKIQFIRVTIKQSSKVRVIKNIIYRQKS